MTYEVCDDGVMRPATTDEIAEFEALASAALLPQVPQTVTAFQAKAALLAAGLYTAVNTYMTTMAPMLDQLAWQEQIIYSPNDAIIASLMQALGLTSSQLNTLFIAAAQITP